MIVRPRGGEAVGTGGLKEQMCDGQSVESSHRGCLALFGSRRWVGNGLCWQQGSLRSFPIVLIVLDVVLDFFVAVASRLLTDFVIP